MANLPAPTGSTILDAGKTPAEWVQIMAGRGVEISDRTIRDRARELGLPEAEDFSVVERF